MQRCSEAGGTTVVGAGACEWAASAWVVPQWGGLRVALLSGDDSRDVCRTLAPWPAFGWGAGVLGWLVAGIHWMAGARDTGGTRVEKGRNIKTATTKTLGRDGPPATPLHTPHPHPRQPSAVRFAACSLALLHAAPPVCILPVAVAVVVIAVATTLPRRQPFARPRPPPRPPRPLPLLAARPLAVADRLPKQRPKHARTPRPIKHHLGHAPCPCLKTTSCYPLFARAVDHRWPCAQVK